MSLHAVHSHTRWKHITLLVCVRTACSCILFSYGAVVDDVTTVEPCTLSVHHESAYDARYLAPPTSANIIHIGMQTGGITAIHKMIYHIKQT